ncbi:YceD family protein [uncultured Rhodoferax sp.]|uniref:YceD family protein n=1 Tax=uncultured Rhodoferax sp. TaxID=223188 RepID=UPI0025F9CE43|nr:YceD family protein [uncultured Rhodoferax sp.]
MTHEYSALSLNITAFAKAGSQLSGQERLAGFERLRTETEGSPEGVQVQFAAAGSVRTDAAGVEEPWLHLRGSTVLTLTCQRCLGPVDVTVDFDRNFRFVASEALAEVEDEESEEDVLVASRTFNVLELVEDELLMAIPAVPKHETCPQAVKLEAVDPDFEGGQEEKPNPFAVLQKLKGGGLG